MQIIQLLKLKKKMIFQEIINKIKSGDLIGINITLPYKQKIVPYLDVLDK